MPPKINSTQHICKICTKVIKYKNLIQCTSCNDCFHSRCVGIFYAKAYNAAGNKYTCSPCSNKLGVKVGCNSSDSDSDDGAKKKASSSNSDLNDGASFVGSDFVNDLTAKCGNMVDKQIQRFLSDIQSKVDSQFEKVKSTINDHLSDIKNEVHKICKQTPNIDDKLSDLNNRIAKLEKKMKFFTLHLPEDIIAE